MINQQLVDYIKQQLQAGISKELVRKALADAGWTPVDIDDSMKAAEPPAQSINPVVAMGGTDPGPRADMGKNDATDRFFSQSASLQSKPVMDMEDDEEHPSAKKFMVALITMGAVILLLAGALAFVYFNMSGQLTNAQQGGAGEPAQAAALQGQVAQLTKDKNDLASQLQTLGGENSELLDEFAFLVAPAGTTTSTQVSAVVKGTLSGNASTTFALRTARNVRILVANSKDSKVAAALAPLANGTSTVVLSGTHAPASLNLTVTSVNGAAL